MLRKPFTDEEIEALARDPKVHPEVKGPPVPKFGHKSFSSYEEFNAWKDEITAQMEREAAEAENNSVEKSG